MVSSVSTYQIVKQYTKRNDATMSTARNPDTATDKAASPVAAPSDQVTLSTAARDKLRLSGAMKSYYEQAQETKKAKARERMAEIKKRIDELKAMLMLYGAMAPKALLRELKQLAGELKGVAKNLQEGGGAGAGNTAIAAASGAKATEEPVQVAETAVEGSAGHEQNAELASAVSADIENADDVVSTEETDSLDNADDTESAQALEEEVVLSPALEAERQQQLQQAQKEDDKRELQKTLAALKSLVNMFKAMLRAEDKDKETEQQFKDIDKLLKDVQESNINISVDMPLV